jgi:hypothetical protein
MEKSLYKKIVTLIIFFLILGLFPYTVPAATRATISSVQSPLSENNLNGAEISVTISGDKYVNSLTTSHFKLQNAPSGTSIAKVFRQSDTVAILTLAYNGTDMTSNSSMSIEVQISGLVSSPVPVGSNSLLIIYMVGQTPRMFAYPNNELTETNLNGAVITFTNPYHDFKTGGKKEDFILENAPIGLTVTNYTFINNRTATITIEYSQFDIDTNYSNFYVRVQGGDTITGGTGASMISNSMNIEANIEDNVNAIITSSPNMLAENTLDGSIINIELSADSFSSTLKASDIHLVNSPSGLTVLNVVKDAPTKARIFLQFNGTDFDNDIPNFSVNVLSSGLSTAPSASSNMLTIQSMIDIEGLGNYNVKGNAYPSIIEMTGYNSKKRQLHFDISLHTDLDVTDKVATFHYYIKVYNENGIEIGNIGDINSATSITAASGVQDVNLYNQVITLNQDLPNSYRIVAIVESITIN